MSGQENIQSNEPSIKEVCIDNIGVPLWLQSLANAVNDTYYYTNNQLFTGVVPSFMRPYLYRYVRPCLNWLDGYVPTLHNGVSGIVSTKIGKSLITGLTKTVIGEKLVLKMNEECPADIDKKNFKKASKWVQKIKLIKPIFSGVGWSLASGTSFIKANLTIDNRVWWESVRFDHCAVTMNSLGEVQDATFLIRNYTETGNTNEPQFFLCEHRYYKEVTKAQIKEGTYEVLAKKGDKVPMVEYVVQRVQGTITSNGNVPVIKSCHKCNWDELPSEVRKMIKQDYGCIRIGEPQKLGFTNIAVSPLVNGLQDLGVPNAANLGQGLLFEIQDDMIKYEVACSYSLRDMNNGKGTVYMPKSISMGDIANQVMGIPQDAMGGVPNTVEMMKGVDPESQKAIVSQFEIREDEWQKAKDDAIRCIATKWHMSPKIISSYLANGVSQMTATQVDSEDDISIAFINLTRSYFIESINDLLETSLNAMGIPTNITVGFASPSVVNKDRVIKRQIDLLEAGLTSVEDAIREIYPDLEEEQIQKKLKEALAAREEIKQKQQDEMNFDGTFGDIIDGDDPQESEKNLNGQTNNEQFTNPNIN